MLHFILNSEDISTELPAGTTVLDFVRYHQNLKGTKIGCREGDCGACTILVGELNNDSVKYRSMTSCLMPLANAAGKHIVTVEGINPENGGLTPVQQEMVDESGTQCGFCTVGFIMSLTGFCIDETAKTPEMAVSAVDGNICRCTGYKSIERAAFRICDAVTRGQGDTGNTSVPPGEAGGLKPAIDRQIVPEYFSDVYLRLRDISPRRSDSEFNHPLPQVVPTGAAFVGGGTDLYVQKPDVMAGSASRPLFDTADLRGVRDTGEFIEIGASATVTDLLVSPVMQSIFPDLYKHLKLVSSTPIRNMATLAGNFVNASPIGDMTVWFLALNAEVDLEKCGSPHVSKGETRTLPLKDLYLDYKQLAKRDDEIITAIRFRKPGTGFRFNFEKVCKRTYLDIATVNTAISLKSVPPAVARGFTQITEAHVAAGGVAPIPLYLAGTSEFLRGKDVTSETVTEANEIMQSEVSPISDVRGTEEYKRLLLRQLFTAHFVELFKID
jgi:xanthine dehydrogenase small subunit